MKITQIDQIQHGKQTKEGAKLTQ